MPDRSEERRQRETIKANTVAMNLNPDEKKV